MHTSLTPRIAVAATLTASLSLVIGIAVAVADPGTTQTPDAAAQTANHDPQPPGIRESSSSTKRVRINLLDHSSPARRKRPQKTRSDASKQRALARQRALAKQRRAAEEQAPEPAALPAPEEEAGRCPDDMVRIRDGSVRACMDRFEAPNRPGSLPLVMYTYYQAEGWCAARGKRLCYDDEWIRACQGPRGWNYPYGPTHRPGACNDGKTWLQYDRILQRRWPTQASRHDIEGLDELMTNAATFSPNTAESAEHIQWLYQAEPSGARVSCVSHEGVFDLIGNVEEWVHRREGGRPEFTNRLMGRFWAEQFHCGQTVSNHGNGFRFYEIGFRCCKDL